MGWEINPVEGGGIDDAPSDGKTYGRKDAAWAEVVSVGGPAILDSERYSLERATGGQQTIIRDSAGNANCMFVLPRFRYEDLGMSAGMGATRWRRSSCATRWPVLIPNKEKV